MFQVLQWARSKGCPWNERTGYGAVWGGHIHVVRWCFENGCPWDVYTCASAAGAGHLEVLQYLRQNQCPWNEETCSSAAGRGHLEVTALFTRWLISVCVWVCLAGCDSPLASLAGDCGHSRRWHCRAGIAGLRTPYGWLRLTLPLQVLIWARANGCRWDANTLKLATERGWRATAKWALENGCPAEG